MRQKHTVTAVNASAENGTVHIALQERKMPKITEQEARQYTALKQGRHLLLEERDGNWAAGLGGLIAYGSTKADAIARLKDMFSFKVDTMVTLMEQQDAKHLP
jgi:hypothetical protein